MDERGMLVTWLCYISVQAVNRPIEVELSQSQADEALNKVKDAANRLAAGIQLLFEQDAFKAAAAELALNGIGYATRGFYRCLSWKRRWLF